MKRNPMSVSESHLLEPPPNRQPVVMIPTPNHISTGEEVQPKTTQSMVNSGTSSLYHHGTAPAVSNSLALTNGTHQNSTVSSSFGARAIPSSMTTLSRTHMDQTFSLTRFNPYANQGLTSTSYGPQIDPKVNSINSRPHTNWHDTFPNGKHQPVPHDYWVNTSNNTNGE